MALRPVFSAEVRTDSDGRAVVLVRVADDQDEPMRVAEELAALIEAGMLDFEVEAS